MRFINKEKIMELLGLFANASAIRCVVSIFINDEHNIISERGYEILNEINKIEL